MKVKKINIGSPNGKDEYVDVVLAKDLKDLTLYVYQFYVGSGSDMIEGIWATSQEEADGYFWQYTSELGVEGQEVIIEDCYEYKIPLKEEK
jgi:hypothetical protein